MESLKKLFAYISEYKYLIYISIFFLLVGNIGNIILPYYIGQVIDLLSNYSYKSDITSKFFSVLVIIIISNIFLYIGNLLICLFLPKISYKIRKKLFSKLLNLPINFFDTCQQGNILTNASIDVEYLNNSMQQILLIFFSLCANIVSLVIVMFITSAFLSNIILAILLVITIIFTMFFKILIRYYSYFHIAISRINTFVNESYTNIEVLTTENISSLKETEFTKLNENLKNITQRIGIISYILSPICNIFIYFLLIFVLSYGSICILNGKLFLGKMITLGILQTYTQYIIRFITPINQLGELLPHFQYLLSSCNNIFKFLSNEEESTILSKTSCQKTKTKAFINFNNIKFNTNNETILDNLNLTINKGEKIAIIGSTGSGKTTILNLLLNFYQPSSGEIKIDNRNINSYNKINLYDKIGVIFQEPWIFQGTVLDNIKYGKFDSTYEEIVCICKYIGLHNAITKLPFKYNTVITSESKIISQGQMQLICICRTLLKLPRIIIMDEVTSFIDSIYEKHIVDALDSYISKHGITSITVAHKLYTIKRVDRVYKLENNKLNLVSM